MARCGKIRIPQTPSRLARGAGGGELGLGAPLRGLRDLRGARRRPWTGDLLGELGGTPVKTWSTSGFLGGLLGL